MGLEKVGQKVAGKVLTPVVWVLNYAVNGSTPDKVDVGLFGMGLMGSVAGPAAIVTGLVKAAVDDDMDQRLRGARNSEKAQYRSHIKACYRFEMTPPQINATKIAIMGGTAWQHPNGLSVYVTDAKGYHIPNFKPNGALQTYQPKWPLVSTGNGKFMMTINR